MLFANESFLCKILVELLSSNIPLYIEKNPVEKRGKVLEMELKTYTPIGLKFVFQKIKFNFIRQRPGLIKDQTSIFKSLTINNFVLKYCHTF